MPKLVLASNSPRRAELLRQIDMDFVQFGVDIDETPKENEQASTLVEPLALEKARAAYSSFFIENSVPQELQSAHYFLGSDTLGALNGRLLLKPRDEADAHQMLAAMSSRSHQIYSSVALVGSDFCEVRVNCTEVEMREISAEEIRCYWASGEPVDKSGGYAIQGKGGLFVSQIRGSYSSVVGLPLLETSDLLQKAGFNIWPATYN